MVHTTPTADLSFDSELIRKYDGFGPRYTSYPTADRFTERFASEQFVDSLLEHAAGATVQPLSLYVHLPFCDTICYYCVCNKIITRDHGRSEKYIRYLAKEVGIVCGLVDSASPVTQLHWGGGTPTFLAAQEMTKLWRVLRGNFTFAPNSECSVQKAVNRIRSEAETGAVLDASRATGSRSLNVDLIRSLSARARRACSLLAGHMIVLVPETS